ncbi:MAG: hypothetical protein JWN25_2904 [Verrucomicrobiales bacterium]|nr:hypothetical protein [Verrucomicrobiales bacterium]
MFEGAVKVDSSKGGSYVVDNLCNSYRLMALGTRDLIHYGRYDSPAFNSGYSRPHGPNLKWQSDHLAVRLRLYPEIPYHYLGPIP